MQCIYEVTTDCKRVTYPTGLPFASYNISAPNFDAAVKRVKVKLMRGEYIREVVLVAAAK